MTELQTLNSLASDNLKLLESNNEYVSYCGESDTIRIVCDKTTHCVVIEIFPTTENVDIRSFSCSDYRDAMKIYNALIFYREHIVKNNIKELGKML